MIIPITGVLADGSLPAAEGLKPLVPFRQDQVVPRGEDVVIQLTVNRANHQAANLTGIQNVKMALRKFMADTVAVFVITATPVNLVTGRMDIVIDSAETIDLIELFSYVFDIELTDGAGDRSQLVPVSRWSVAGIVARPGE